MEPQLFCQQILKGFEYTFEYKEFLRKPNTWLFVMFIVQE